VRRWRATGSSATPNGKRRLAGDTARAATSDEVKALRQEARAEGIQRWEAKAPWLSNAKQPK
jgi:hypothetical protein